LLENLPQSVKNRDHIKRLCDTVLDASPHLRLVWIGFSDGDEAMVAPHAAIGECVPEAEEWSLPRVCFEQSGPYSQAALESVGALNDLNSLFAPWRGNLDACSANCALAIPLRSDRPNVRGLVVFYADDVSYFAYTGAAPFRAFCHIAEIIWQQSNLLQMLTEKAQIDTLTGLMNRRKTSYVLKKAVERAAQEKEPLSIMLLRLEGFGKINDTHGWRAADMLLASFAREITLQTRAQDKVGRWTGVEFMYIMPRTDQKHAEFLAQGLQSYFASHPLYIQHQPILLSLHIGVAAFDNAGMSLDELVTQASRHMHASIGAIPVMRHV
jgi:diguanylate cyclase (GGDEF)-like protein